MPLSGKSTLTDFLSTHIQTDVLQTRVKVNVINILGVEEVIKVMRKHISEDENPVLHQEF